VCEAYACEFLSLPQTTMQLTFLRMTTLGFGLMEIAAISRITTACSAGSQATAQSPITTLMGELKLVLQS
jgi:hypothetical protein